jgi:hypothetical protein
MTVEASGCLLIAPARGEGQMNGFSTMLRSTRELLGGATSSRGWQRRRLRWRCFSDRYDRRDGTHYQRFVVLATVGVSKGILADRFDRASGQTRGRRNASQAIHPPTISAARVGWLGGRLVPVVTRPEHDT